MRLMPLALAAAMSLGALTQGSTAEGLTANYMLFEPGEPIAVAPGAVEFDAASIIDNRSAVPPTP